MSRQSNYQHQRSVEALRERALAAPLLVGYDAELQKFVVSWLDDPDTVLIAARHEVAAAYIDGFVRAWINQPWPEVVKLFGQLHAKEQASMLVLLKYAVETQT
jgi:hypothetical protein